MKMNKKKILESTASNKNIIFGVLVIILVFCICIFPLINKGTYSEMEDGITITCPEEAIAGETIECSIAVNASSIKVSGISAKYRVSSGVVYEGLYLDLSFSKYNDLLYKESDGFVLINDEIGENIGLVKYSVPSNALVDSVYKIELVDVVFGDGEDNELNVSNASSSITIKANSGENPEPELSKVNTLESITVTNGVFNKIFNKDDNSYIVTVDADSFTIDFTKTDNKSVVSGILKEYSFDENNSITINIKVTSESGVDNIYLLTVNKKTDDYKLVFSNNLKIDNDNKYIKFIPIKTTVSQLLNGIDITNGNVKVYDKENEEKENDKLLASGDVLRVYANDTLKDEYVISVSGDSNGDGKVSSLDLVQARKHLVGYIEEGSDEMYKKTGVYEVAIDLNQDGKISTLDIIKIRMIIVEVE